MDPSAETIISNPDNILQLRVCRDLFNKQVSGLNNSVASFKNLYSFTELEVLEYVVVFKRIKTYQQACLVWTNWRRVDQKELEAGPDLVRASPKIYTGPLEKNSRSNKRE